MERDSYVVQLDRILSEIESTYDIFEDRQHLDDMRSVIRRVDSQVVAMSSEDIMQQNMEVGKQIVMLSYLCFRLSYFKCVRLDYSKFPVMQEIVDVLDLYRDKQNFNRAVRQVNKIIKVLVELDSISAKARAGLGYRFLRIFVVMVMYRNSCNAAIIAEFIIQQICIRGQGR